MRTPPVTTGDVVLSNRPAGEELGRVASGQPIGELDMVIAAHSLSAGAVLVTNNTLHYARIAAPLTLVNWTGAA